MPGRTTGDRDDRTPSTLLGVCAAYVLTAALCLSWATPASAIHTVPGSPCADTCTRGGLDYANSTVCFDQDYQTGDGQQFRECTTCLLNSTAVDAAANVSDVYWGLFNLRYTLAECMFAYPAEIVSISSPCQVTCQPLQPAVAFDIGSDVATATDDTTPTLDYCGQGQFGNDFKVNNCSFCYSYIPQQLFMANFLQALHIACRQPPAIGSTFYPDGRAIFNESAIPGPAPPKAAGSGGSGLTGWKLGLAVALPIVGGVLLFGLSCFCCFKFTKKRRLRMAASGRMSTFHERQPGSTMSSAHPYKTPPSQYEWPMGQYEAGQEMERISHVPKNGKIPSPGLAQGRWSHHDREDEVHTPLSAVPRDDVGPAADQVKDPYLHEQFFGVASSGVAGEAAAGSSGYVPGPDERGAWVR